MRDEAIRNGNFANGDMEVLAVSGRIATENYFIVPAAPGFELLSYYEPEADETFVVERSPVIAWRIEECQTFDRCSDENPIAISTDSTSAEGHSAVLCPDSRVRIYETSRQWESVEKWLEWVKEDVRQREEKWKRHKNLKGTDQ